MRATSTQQLEARARCRGCTWTADTANAQGIAAQHCDNHQHQVVVTVTTQITYGDPGSDHHTPGGAVQTAIPIPGAN